MKSTSGEHYIALDHIRALAAFMVFTWHFIRSGYAVPLEITPSVFPLALLDEGHVGVGLFMVLSGYLFAKLLRGKNIHYGAFLWNRALRLLPLLSLVILVVFAQRMWSGARATDYAKLIGSGVLLPTLPNGGWSITVEFHYYLLLPAFLWLLRNSRLLLLGLVAAAIAVRLAIHQLHGEVQSLAYWTIIGRLDQFAFGMLAFHFRGLLKDRHAATFAMMIAFSLFYWWFDRRGGFYQMPSYPSASPIWVLLPTIEGIALASAVAWYDSSFDHSQGKASQLVARFGEYSYSIYLLHFFVVDEFARLIAGRVMGLSNFYIACVWSSVCFCLMMPIGFLSFRFIEKPFLKYRRRYTRSDEVCVPPAEVRTA